MNENHSNKKETETDQNFVKISLKLMYSGGLFDQECLIKMFQKRHKRQLQYPYVNLINNTAKISLISLIFLFIISFFIPGKITFAILNHIQNNNYKNQQQKKTTAKSWLYLKINNPSCA